MPDPGSESTDLERVRKRLRSDDTREFLRALQAVLVEALRSQQIASREAGKVAEIAVDEGHREALAELVLLLLADRWMIRL
ncbi:MAG: hypothetical protein GY769_02985 [bacterium]|nr:hypothetical protein [bacterium]